jgi:chemotaxis protein CheY-P-specific phosphatase CheC
MLNKFMEIENQFTPAGIKALEEMARKGAKSASSALSKLIDQEVVIHTLHVRSVPIEQVSQFIAKPETDVINIALELSGDVYGYIMLIYENQSALNVVDFLAKRSLGQTKELSELDKSALMESGNIIAGAFLTEISNYLSVNMIELPPNFHQGKLKNTVNDVVYKFQRREIAESIAMEINYEMGTGRPGAAEEIVPEINTSGYFILLLDLPSGIKVTSSLKDISGGKEMQEK